MKSLKNSSAVSLVTINNPLRRLTLPLLAIMALVPVLILTDHMTAAWLVGNLGTLLVLVGNFICIVAKDSRKRWPGTSWKTRLTKLSTFQR